MDLIINDINLNQEYNCSIFPSEKINLPKVGYDKEPKEGEHGDIFKSHDRLENIMLNYKVVFTGNKCQENRKAMFDSLFNMVGYQKLRESDKDYYRDAFFVGGGSSVWDKANDLIKCDLRFDCKPQKWLDEGFVTTMSSTNIGCGATSPIIRFYPDADIESATASTIATVYLRADGIQKRKRFYVSKLKGLNYIDYDFDSEIACSDSEVITGFATESGIDASYKGRFVCPANSEMYNISYTSAYIRVIEKDFRRWKL